MPKKIYFFVLECKGTVVDLKPPIDTFCDICHTVEDAPPVSANNSEIPSNKNIRGFKVKQRFIPRSKTAVNTSKKSAIRDFVLESPKKAKFYTGLTKTCRDSLWEFLGKAKSQLSIIHTQQTSGKLRTMCIESQFLMTLMILRRGYDYLDVAYTYHMSKNTVARVFKTWLMFFYVKFKDIQDKMFTQKKDLMTPLPEVFCNETLKDVRVVIDCTEIPLQNVENYKNQGNIYR